MRRHRAGDAPGRRKGERPQDHGPVDYDVRFCRCRDRRLRARHRGQHEEIQRQPDQDMRESPGEAGVAPANAFEAKSRQRPSDRRGKARNQRDAGDRAARRVAMDASERAEGCVVEAKSHSEPSEARRRPARDRMVKPSKVGPRQTSDWKPTTPTCRRPDRSAGRRAGQQR